MVSKQAFTQFGSFFAPIWPAICLAAVAWDHTEALGALTPQQETRILSQKLKPISDQEWSQIAGSRASQAYEIVSGDSLWDISKRLFGDGHYWPKVWAINSKSITNPHWIQPGNQVVFFPGSGSSLPSLGLRTQTSAKMASSAGARISDSTTASLNKWKTRSEEWKKLPRQRWESVQIRLPGSVDPDGFDRNNKITLDRKTGVRLKAFVSSLPIPSSGLIYASNRASVRLGLGDTVYIRSEIDLEIGNTYTITKEPSELYSEDDDERIGYSYVDKGSVEIKRILEDFYVGEIVSNQFVIVRGDFIIPQIPKYNLLPPVEGPESMKATLLVDKEISTYTTAQHKQVFINRGASDGIEPGMIFRAYQYIDPSNREEITEGSLLPEADFMVVQVTENFSAAIVIYSRRPVDEGTRVILLTDISEFLEGAERDEYEDDKADASEESPIEGEIQEGFDDELDALDDGDDLTEEEKKELQQLEEWEGNPPASEIDAAESEAEEDEEFEEEEFEEDEFDEDDIEEEFEEDDEFEDDEFEDEQFEDDELEDEEFEEEVDGDDTDFEDEFFESDEAETADSVSPESETQDVDSYEAEDLEDDSTFFEEDENVLDASDFQ